MSIYTVLECGFSCAFNSLAISWFAPCVFPEVDRICTGREVTGNDIKVSAEPHVGEVRRKCLALHGIALSGLPCPWLVLHVVLLCVDCFCLESSQQRTSLDALSTGREPHVPRSLQRTVAHDKPLCLDIVD